MNIVRPTILTFVSGKGGVGKTMLAAAAARELSYAGKTLVLDLDLFNRGLTGLLFGGPANWGNTVEPPVFLSKQASHGWLIGEVADNLFSVSFPDVEVNETALASVEGSDVLALSEQLLEWIHALCSQTKCQTVILDCHGGPDPLSFAAAKIADRVFLISEPDRITIYGTLHFLRRAAQLSVDVKKIHLVFSKVTEAFTQRFLNHLYESKLRGYFESKPLLAAFPLEDYLAKHFEHQPFVTDDFPKSMLARKVQMMLADVLPEDSLTERVRTVPRWLGDYWRRSLGRTLKILQIDVIMIVSFVVLVGAAAAYFGLKVLKQDPIVEDYYTTVLIAVPTWAVFTVLLSWTTRLDRAITLASRRFQWWPFGKFASILAFLWAVPVTLIAAIMFFDVATRFFDAIWRTFDQPGLEFLWYAILIVVLVFWANHTFEAYRDFKYRRVRAEPIAKGALGAFILISGPALLVGSFVIPPRMPDEFALLDKAHYSSDNENHQLALDAPAVEGKTREGQVVWYRFEVADEGVYVISVNSDDGDPTVAVYGPNEFTYIWEDDDGGGRLNARIREYLSTGAHYVAVRGFLGSSLNYSVRLTRDEDLPDTFEFGQLRPRDIPDISDMKVLPNNDVASPLGSEEVEWYQFQVTEELLYDISVIGVSGDPTMALFSYDDVSGETTYLVEDDDGGSSLDSHIRQSLQSGRYFVAVRGYRGHPVEYSVRFLVDHNWQRDEDYLREVKETEEGLVSLEENGDPVSGTSNGEADWYRVEVLERGRYQISATGGDQGDPTMVLISETRKVFSASQSVYGVGETRALIDSELEVGVYYVGVRGFQGSELEYSIRFAKGPSASDMIAFSEIRQLPSFSGQQRALQIGSSIEEGWSGGEADWYRFTVEEDDSYTITVTAEYGGDPTVALFALDDHGDLDYVKEDDDGGGGLNSQIERHLDSGEYYVVVRGYRGSSIVYSVTVTRMGR